MISYVILCEGNLKDGDYGAKSTKIKVKMKHLYDIIIKIFSIFNKGI